MNESVHANPSVKINPAGKGPSAGPLYVFKPQLPIITQSLKSLMPGNRRYSQLHKRAHILAAVRQICAEEGPCNIKIRNLAERTGVTPPTIYSNLGCREEVLRQALREAVRGKIELAHNFSAATGIPFPLAYAESTYIAIEKDSDYYGAITRAAISNALDRSIVFEITHEIESAIFKSLEVMHANGRLSQNTLSLQQVARLMTRQNTSSISDWVMKNFSVSRLREELVSGAGLLLLAIVNPEEAGAVKKVLEQL